MESESMKSKLLNLAQSGYDDEVAFVTALSPEERDAVGTPAQWSAKDLIAHITAWKERSLFILDSAMSGNMPPDLSDQDALNAQTFEENRDRPWPKILADAERIVAELMARVQEISEDALVDPNYVQWRQGRPLWQSITGNAFVHPQSHQAEWYLKHGELARATQMQERLADVQRSLDDSPRSHGVASYNLACFYATSGQPEKALSLLPDALRLNPDLVEWSKHDTDLDSLRNDAAFRSLYTTR